MLVAVVVNPQKREPLFTLDERKQMFVAATNHLANVEVVDFRGLLADFAQTLGAGVIVKGLRVVSDFENEMSTALMNRSLSGIDTMFLPSDPQVFVHLVEPGQGSLLPGRRDRPVRSAGRPPRMLRAKRAALRLTEPTEENHPS